MKISKFALKVTEIEGKKREVNIAQINEILAIVNRLTHGILYIIIRLIP